MLRTMSVKCSAVATVRCARLVCLLAFVSAAEPLAAQNGGALNPTPAPADVSVMPEMSPDADAVPDTSETASETTLERCQQERSGYAKLLVEQVVAQSILTSENDECRRTIAGRDDVNLHLLQRNEALVSEVAHLKARLAEARVSERPKFAYFHEDVVASVVPARFFDENAPMGAIGAERCPEALAWLESREGADRPFRLRLWVRGGADGPGKLCRRAAGGTADVVDPLPTDDAHLVLFR